MTIATIVNMIEGHSLAALGLAVPQLKPQWSLVNPTYNGPGSAQPHTLTFAGAFNAPMSGMLSWHSGSCSLVSGLNGQPLPGPGGGVALLTLHPQAYLRLEQLYLQRYDGGAMTTSLRPVPRMLAIQVLAPPVDVGHKTARAGDSLPAGTVSFHCARGHIIDAAAVASAFADLLGAFDPLCPPDDVANLAALLTGVGGATTISGMGAGTFVHVVDLHGRPWRDPGAGQGLSITGGGGRVTGAGPFPVPAGGTVALEAGATDLQLGWATRGGLGAAALTPPAPAAGMLATDFFRVVAVDLRWHLLGNRSTTTVAGIGPAEQITVDEPAPVLRTGIQADVTNLSDGSGLLGTLTAMLPAGAAPPLEDFVVSPALDAAFNMPGGAAVGNRWPADPAPVGAAQTWNPATAGLIRSALGTPQGIQAAWSNEAPGSPHVVLSFPAGLIPGEAHVRVFPRRLEFPSTLFTGARSFVRGDGSAAIAPSAGAWTLRLADPFHLDNGPVPATAGLTFDLMVVPRPGGATTAARLFGGLALTVTGSLAPPAAVPGVNVLAAIPANRQGLSSAPLLGLNAAPTATLGLGAVASVQDLVDVILQIGQEGNPREAPRLPTMSRFESIVARQGGLGAAATWQAILSGAWLTSETHSEQLRLGNPGNPAGPEIHAMGVQVDGPLAYDLGRMAYRRTTPLLQRLPDLGTTDWDEPAGSGGTLAGSLLQTVAPYCESPELGYDNVTDAQLQGLPAAGWVAYTNALEALMPNSDAWAGLIDASKALAVPGAAALEARMVAELHREVYATQRGRRDAQWALKRAIAEARELIYLETPMLTPTAYPDVTGAHTWDLLGALSSALAANPMLKVIVALPESIAFDPGYAAFAQRLYDERWKALKDPSTGLLSLYPQRVVAFHPLGFPGRPVQMRSTVVVVDDVWALVGSSSLTRRGLTFDGSVDLVLTDLTLFNGVSAAIRNLRRALMAQHLGVVPPAAGVAPIPLPDPYWVRLGQLSGAYACVRELLDQGGQGLLEELQENPGSASGVMAVDNDIASPDGRAFLGAAGATSTLLTWLSSSLSGAGV